MAGILLVYSKQYILVNYEWLYHFYRRSKGLHFIYYRSLVMLIGIFVS